MVDARRNALFQNICLQFVEKETDYRLNILEQQACGCSVDKELYDCLREGPVRPVNAFFSGVLRFIHQGQLEGVSKKIALHLNRAPPEAGNQHLSDSYERLLYCLRGAACRHALANS